MLEFLNNHKIIESAVVLFLAILVNLSSINKMQVDLF